MLHNIPFSIPTEFAGGLANGSIVRIGTLLKDVSSGRIVAHVQETGLAQHLVSAANMTPFSPFNVTNLASSAYASAQLAQIKAMVGGLQLLGFTSLGVAAAGLGVSVVGFVLVTRRLKGIENSISGLSRQMDMHFAKAQEERLREHLARVGVLLERTDQIPHRSNAGRAWLTTEEALALEAGFFRAEIRALLDEQTFNADLLEMLTSALLMANAARIQCLLKADEMNAARHSAIEISETYCSLFDPIGTNMLAAKIMPTDFANSEEEFNGYRTSRRKAKAIAAELREASDVALSRPYLLDHLAEREIPGPVFLETMSSINYEPIVLLRE